MLFAFSIFLFFLAVYSKGVSPTVFGGDSGDIVLSYYFAGVAHPPGYPLNTMLGWFLTRIPIGETFAFRANFVSAIYSSLSLAILFLVLQKLLKDKLISLAVVLSLGFVHLFWLYAHNAEVFQLSLVLVSSSLYFLLRSLDSKVKKKQFNFDVICTLFLLGLAVFHHQTNILLVPGYIFLLFRKKIIPFRNLVDNMKAILAFSFGFLPYIFIPFAAFRRTPLNWDDPSNIQGFLRLITRADYGTFTAAIDLVGFSSAARLLQILWYAKVVIADFTFVGIGLMTLGVYYLFLKNKDFLIFLLVTIFLSGPFFLFYASFPVTDSFLLGVSERFLLINYLFLTILFAFGGLKFVNILFGLVRSYFPKKEIYTLFAKLSLFLIPLAFFSLNYVKADLSKANEAETLAKDVLNSAEPAGIIFLRGDTISFNVLFEYHVNHLNYQSIPIMAGRLRHASYRRDLMHNFPSLKYEESFKSNSQMTHSTAITKLVVDNKDTLPIYSIDAFPLDPKKYVWIQEGMLKKLYYVEELPKNEEIVSKVRNKASNISFDPLDTKSRYINFYTDDILDTYKSIYTSISEELLKKEDLVAAKQYLEKANQINSNDYFVLKGFAEVYSKEGNCKESKAYYNRIENINEMKYFAYLGLGELYRDCFKDKMQSQFYFDKASEIKSKQDDVYLDTL